MAGRTPQTFLITAGLFATLLRSAGAAPAAVEFAAAAEPEFAVALPETDARFSAAYTLELGAQLDPHLAIAAEVSTGPRAKDDVSDAFDETLESLRVEGRFRAATLFAGLGTEPVTSDSGTSAASSPGLADTLAPGRRGRAGVRVEGVKMAVEAGLEWSGDRLRAANVVYTHSLAPRWGAWEYRTQLGVDAADGGRELTYALGLRAVTPLRDRLDLTSLVETARVDGDFFARGGLELSLADRSLGVLAERHRSRDVTTVSLARTFGPVEAVLELTQDRDREDTSRGLGLLIRGAW